MSPEKAGTLRQETEEKANAHGDDSHEPQLLWTHLYKLPEPALHGLGRGYIGQSFQDQDQADECYE